MNVQFQLILVFILKHFVADFLLQNRWMASHKHILTHPGGWVHAGIQGLSTFLILWAIPYVSVEMALGIGLMETFIHYTIDFTKINIGRYFEFTPDMWKFWVLIGIDQMLHQLTYMGFIYLILQM